MKTCVTLRNFSEENEPLNLEIECEHKMGHRINLYNTEKEEGHER